MDPRVSKTVLATVLLGGLLAASSALAIELSEKERAALAAGKTIEKPLPSSGENGFFGGTGLALVDAPIEEVWAAIADWGSYAKMFPKTVAVTEESRKGDQSLIHMEMGHALIRAEYYMTVERDRTKLMISFRLVKNRPHDIEDTRGYWRLFPQADGRTLVAYVVATQIPMGIINLLSPDLIAKIERNLLNVPNDLKLWVEGPHGNRYRTAVAAK
jgi:ribosome-associated toxin RatA of RatAB toxin-antitoxin module